MFCGFADAPAALIRLIGAARRRWVRSAGKGHSGGLPAGDIVTRSIKSPILAIWSERCAARKWRKVFGPGMVPCRQVFPASHGRKTRAINADGRRSTQINGVSRDLLAGLRYLRRIGRDEEPHQKESASACSGLKCGGESASDFTRDGSCVIKTARIGKRVARRSAQTDRPD